VRFKNTNSFFYFDKNALVYYYNAGVVVVNREAKGLAPRANPTTSKYTTTTLDSFFKEEKHYLSLKRNRLLVAL
jgi:hypothetical protein